MTELLNIFTTFLRLATASLIQIWSERDEYMYALFAFILESSDLIALLIIFYATLVALYKHTFIYEKLTKQIYFSIVVIFFLGSFLIWVFWGEGPDEVRNIVLILGIVGGAYGIILASERQKTFSEQIAHTQTQVFNEHLGRGVKFLYQKKDPSMRHAGIKVLAALAKTATQPDQSRLIVEIIHDFVVANAQPKYEEDGETIKIAKTRISRTDVELAVKQLPLLLEKAKMTVAEISFSGLDLQYLDFSNHRITKVDFSNAIMQGVNFTDAMLEEVEFSNANLNNAVFHSAKIRKVDFTDIIMKEADFLSSKLSEVDFEGLTSPELNFTLSELHGVNFKDATIIRANFSWAELKNAQFDFSNLNQSTFENATFDLVDFKGAELKMVDFTRAKLSEAIFTESDLSEANLNHANLKSANFRGANLTNSKLQGADISGTNFEGVQGLTQNQLSSTVYQKDSPPENLPLELTLPTYTAYE